MANINTYIKPNYIKKTLLLNKLSKELCLCLPPSFISHYCVTGITEQRLSISVNSSSWANKIKFYESDIKKHFFQTRQIQLKTIKISVNPQSISLPKVSLPKSQLSTASAHTLKSLADTIEDASLKQSILKLSKRKLG